MSSLSSSAIFRFIKNIFSKGGTVFFKVTCYIYVVVKYLLVILSNFGNLLPIDNTVGTSLHP